MPQPSYLLQRNNTFYFRTRIPAEWVPVVQRQVICVSLRTSDKREALMRSGILANKLHAALNVPTSMANKPAFNLILTKLLRDGTSATVDFDPANVTEAKWVEEKFGDVLAPASVAPSAQTFSDLRDAYLVELEKRKKHSALESCSHTFRLFIELMGNIPASDLSQGRLGEFKRLIERLPASYSKKKELKDKPVRELVELGLPPISAKTLSNHIANVVSLNLWARSNYDGIPELTAKGVTPAKESDAHEERDAFTQDDINQLFAPEVFDHLDDQSKWLLRLGALTGARIEELCQIELSSDIRQTDKGVWYLSINTEGDKSIKTASAKREIPLHPTLISLGVLEFFEAQRKAGASRPFELRWKRYERKWSKYASKWFGGYKTKVFGKVEGKVFHSFRHTFITCLKKAGVEEGLTAALVGHSAGSITYSRYGKPFDADDLRPIVGLVELPVR
jgi:integrase